MKLLKMLQYFNDLYYCIGDKNWQANEDLPSACVWIFADVVYQQNYSFVGNKFKFPISKLPHDVIALI